MLLPGMPLSQHPDVLSNLEALQSALFRIFMVLTLHRLIQCCPWWLSSIFQTPLPSPEVWGWGLSSTLLVTWLVPLATSLHSPRVYFQVQLKGAYYGITKDSLLPCHSETPRVLGGLCQELGTKYIYFLYVTMSQGLSLSSPHSAGQAVTPPPHPAAGWRR